MAPSVYAFDVNETLLDVAALAPLFERIFGDGDAWRDWFAQMLSLAFVARPGMVADPLAPAPDIVGADLGAVAEHILAARGSE
jgi:2-haloacid dehalogenase